jgi:hypothetical protein
MNDMPEKDDEDMDRLQRALEDATARDDRDAGRAASDDRDTAAMRETWLAFGRLLEAAEVAEGPWKKTIAREPKLLRRRYLVALTTVAAAVCLTLAIGWWLAADRRSSNHDTPVVRSTEPQQVQPQAAKGSAAIAVQTPARHAPLIVRNDATPIVKKPAIQKQSAGAACSSVWDAAIETQITAVSQQIDAVQQTWQHRVDDVDLVQYHIDEVSAGLANDPL